MLAYSSNNIASIKLIEPVWALNTLDAVFELFLRLLQRFKLICSLIFYLTRLCYQGRIILDLLISNLLILLVKPKLAFINMWEAPIIHILPLFSTFFILLSFQLLDILRILKLYIHLMFPSRFGFSVIISCINTEFFLCKHIVLVHQNSSCRFDRSWTKICSILVHVKLVLLILNDLVAAEFLGDFASGSCCCCAWGLGSLGCKCCSVWVKGSLIVFLSTSHLLLYYSLLILLLKHRLTLKLLSAEKLMVVIHMLWKAWVSDTNVLIIGVHTSRRSKMWLWCEAYLVLYVSLHLSQSCEVAEFSMIEISWSSSEATST